MEFALPLAAFLVFLGIHLAGARRRGQSLNEYMAASRAEDLRNPTIYLGASGIISVFIVFSVLSNGEVPNWPMFILLTALAAVLAAIGVRLLSRPG